MKKQSKFDKAFLVFCANPRKHPEAVAEFVGCSISTVYAARKKHYEEVAPVQMDIEDVISESTEAEPLRVEEQLVMDRGKHYGHPLDNFQDIHAAKTVIAKCEDVAVRHALEMIWLKVTRLVETPDHQDSIDDIKGYAETINMIHAERKRRGIE